MFQVVNRSLIAAALLGVLALTSFSHDGFAQTSAPAPQSLPETVVTASRLGNGIPGASTTIITSEEIERSTGTLQDLLARQAGIQSTSLFGGVNGAQQNIDMRGFGLTATANTLVLINGRRLNDVDLGGVDFSAIPRDSIERIEITRGNSGGVLYGDGAMGGVINIVTKTAKDMTSTYRADGALGSFNHREGSASTRQIFGPYSLTGFGNVITADGYRQNNKLEQRNIVTEARFDGGESDYFINLSADEQELGLPGGRLVTPQDSGTIQNPRGAATPADYGYKRGVNLTLGGTRDLGNGIDLIVDGGVRRKDQHTASFVAGSNSYVDTVLTTYSITPRTNIVHSVFGLPAKSVLGIDAYYSDYESDRGLHKNDPPEHRYEINQRSTSVYGQGTLGIRSDTDLSMGLRLQNVDFSARDRFNPAAPGAQFTPQGVPLDRQNTHYAAHLGAEHRLTDTLALFGRTGRSIRVPTVDERVGLAAFGVPATFDTQVQTSHDYEGGFRKRWGTFQLQSSAYLMYLRNEIHFDPVSFTNVNLDPTFRRGIENSVTYAFSDTLRFRGALSYTKSTFREGRFQGSDVPIVSDWTGSAGFGWDIVPKFVVFDLDGRYVGERRMDNDQRNFQPTIPARKIFDAKIGGEYEQLRWSLAAQNLLNDKNDFDYAVASTATFNRYNAYPLPGRILMARMGAAF